MQPATGGQQPAQSSASQLWVLGGEVKNGITIVQFHLDSQVQTTTRAPWTNNGRRERLFPNSPIPAPLVARSATKTGSITPCFSVAFCHKKSNRFCPNGGSRGVTGGIEGANGLGDLLTGPGGDYPLLGGGARCASRLQCDCSSNPGVRGPGGLLS